MGPKDIYRKSNYKQTNDNSHKTDTNGNITKIIKNGTENVMIIYDPGDDFTENTIFPVFASKQITFTVWMQIPGRLTLQFFEYIPQKLLIVLSQEVMAWNILSHLATAACLLYGEQYSHKIITLITTGKITNTCGWSCLKRTSVINFKPDNYVEMLLHKVRYIPQPYFRVYSQGNDLVTTLRMSGIGMRNIEAEIFGLFVLVGKSCVQIDLQEFHKFLEKHQKYKTSENLELSGLFRFQKTAAYLVLNGNTDKYMAAKADIAEICSSVVETTEEKQDISNWDIVCTVRGNFSEKQEQFISSLYPKIWAGMTGKYVSSIKTPKHADFEEERKRIDSFPNDCNSSTEKNEISSESLGKAGLFHTGTGDRGTCYFCGCTMTNIRNQSDPLTRHASQHPDCSFVRGKLSPAQIETAVSNFNSSDIKDRVATSLAERFSDFEARIKTFQQHEGDHEHLQEHYEALAKSGFYYVGGRDNIQCFSCSNRLYVFPPKDCIWEAHAMVGPSCSHIKNEKPELLRQMQKIMNFSIQPGQTVVKITKETYDKDVSRDEYEVIFRPW